MSKMLKKEKESPPSLSSMNTVNCEKYLKYRSTILKKEICEETFELITPNKKFEKT